MADTSRRKGGAAAARSHQTYMQMNAARTPTNQPGGPRGFAGTPTNQPGVPRGFAGTPTNQQGGPRGFAGTPTNQQGGSRGFAGTPTNANRGGGFNKASNGRGGKGQLPAKMGIKSGMTVEDLKRLTQKRIQQSGGPGTPRSPAVGPHEGFGRPATPKINAAAANASTTPAAPSGLPKTGMTVQELKQLTTLRLASQSVPMRQTEITGLVSNAVLTNAAKSQYRDTLRSSLTPSSTSKRTQFGALPHRDVPSNNDVIPVRGHRSRSRSSQLAKTVEPPVDIGPTRYSYSGPLEDYLGYDYSIGDGDNSTSSQETDSFAQPSFDDEDGGKRSFDESHRGSTLQFPDDAFPPPPPLDASGGFVTTALPSWSPPPARAKKLESSSTPVSFYNPQTSYYSIASKDDGANQDQNAVIAPPPGLSRRPSMTVPWQVAEAVLNTPQTVTTRKKLASPTSSSNTASEPESSNMTRFDEQNLSSGMKTPAAEAAVQLGALTSQLARNRSGSGAPPLSGPPGSASSINGARRGSFGNAAEFFKFRRRSKSRLELARDLQGNFMGSGEVDAGFPNYGTSGMMPGIDETQGDVQETRSNAGRDDTVSDASSSTSENDDDGSSSQDYTDEDVVQVTGGYDDTAEISNNFVQFYHASGASGRSSRDNLNLSIPPPPPPPPMMDDDDVASSTSSKGLPMMSPNGLRLRKVAELARRGSLSVEDKTRAKDEIIQSSLGIGATNAARILTSKMTDRTGVPASAIVPPPGFGGLAPVPANKTVVSGTGGARYPATASTPLVSSPHGSLSKKTIEPETNDSDGPSLEERLAAAAQKVANCVSKGDMVNFQKAMDELDWLRNEANKMMRG